MAGNVICFRSGEWDMKIQGSVADSSGRHIIPKPRSDLGPWNCTTSRKRAYKILTPFKPHFYMVKLGFTGVYIIFLISA